MQVSLTPMHAAAYAPSAAGQIDLADHEGLIARIDQLLNRAEGVLAKLQPEGAIRPDEVTPALARYFAMREQVRYLDDAVERYLDAREHEAARPNIEPSASRISEDRPRRSTLSEALPMNADAWLTLRSPNELRTLLSARAEDTGEEPLRGRLHGLLAAAAWLHLMLEREPMDDERVALVVRSVNGRATWGPEQLAGTLGALMRKRFDLVTEEIEFPNKGAAAGHIVTGYLAHDLCAAVTGLHLMCNEAGVVPVSIEALAADAAFDSPADLHDGRIAQVHYIGGQTLDARAAMVSRERPSLALLSRWLLESLPLPGVDA
jgi:hypothetical protein